MERWEYQVIHLNVEASAPAPPAAPPASLAPPPGGEPATGTPPIRAEAVFSKEYLEKEFPGFYGASPPAGAAAREHPANQLRGFLNLQGRDGWQLLGIYPVGQLQMMIFRRLLTPAPVSGEPASSASAALPGTDSEPAEAAAPVQAEPSPPPCESSPAPPREQGALLESILARLQALERRLPPPPSAAAAPPPPLPNAATGLQDGEILPLQRWGSLETLPRLSTPEAARALGFRSAASLLNLAARSGYREGLLKRGVNGAVAVYMGSEKSGRGGRDRRLWVVLPAAAG